MKNFMIAAVLSLAGCGTLNQSNPVQSIAQGLLSGGASDESQPATNVAAAINREFIEAQPNDLMIASVISRNATAVLVRGGNNGSRVTWLSPDGIGVTFQDGVLISTRGLGADLMGADVSGVLNSVSSGGNYLRQHSYLNGLDQIETAQFQCSISVDRSETIEIYERSYDTTVHVEVCQGAQDRFRNLYWIASDGVIWQSRQWISAEVGYLGSQRL